MAPSGLGFIVGSQLAPRIVRVVRPAHLIGSGLAASAVGLLLMTRLGVTGGVPLALVASVIIALGLAPVFGITTELIVGSAPQEQAGAAAGVSETGAELGGALGTRFSAASASRSIAAISPARCPPICPAKPGARRATHWAARCTPPRRYPANSAKRYCGRHEKHSCTGCT
nr:hypothetical protein [Nocardia asiatica]